MDSNEENNELKIDAIKKNSFKKRENKKKLYIILIAIIIIIILMLAFFIIYKNLENNTKITYEDNYKLYQYFTGIKVNYDGKITISTDGNIIKIKSNKEIDNIEDVPIYFENEDNSILTSKNMQLIFPNYKNKNYKLKYFTKIIYDNENNISYYENKNKKRLYLDDAFLYDGNNLYIFLDNVTILIDEHEYNLSPLSYITVNYKSEIEIYDKLNDKYTIINSHNNDVITKLGNYNVNLSTDMIYNEKDSYLLMKNDNNLKEYE